ncbi:hypothetical protein [Methylobacterium sp. R2-1]|uniref:hypothetical protein n=1 Tax=Methylobacterium sp. R2-1 TaxID=2587064 RepID=UPI0016084B0F|nr:hypothetical protein [Methylobacterium sp. R2-1]MBB2964338.1 hypothetical protein [Methylobacterium sp. R2-1]
MGQRATISQAAQALDLSGRAASARESAARHLPSKAEAAQFADPQAYADGFDFSPFTTADMAFIYKIARDTADFWRHVANMPRCNEPSEWAGIPRPTTLGRFADFECERLGFLSDRCVQELSRRKPADDDERDHILCTQILHEIECSGRIDRRDAPTLLIEALKAWG